MVLYMDFPTTGEQKSYGACDSCPRVKHLLQNIVSNELLQGVVANAAQQPADSDMSVEAIAEMISNLADIPGEDVARVLRQNLATFLDVGDELNDDQRANITILTATCAGPLAMRAIKNDIQYTARLCTSSLLEQDSEDCDEVHVTRVAQSSSEL